MKTKIFLILAFTLLCYSSIGFFKLNFNVFEWSEVNRFCLIAAFWLGCVFITWWKEIKEL